MTLNSGANVTRGIPLLGLVVVKSKHSTENTPCRVASQFRSASFGIQVRRQLLEVRSEILHQVIGHMRADELLQVSGRNGNFDVFAVKLLRLRVDVVGRLTRWEINLALIANLVAIMLLGIHLNGVANDSKPNPAREITNT